METFKFVIDIIKKDRNEDVVKQKRAQFDELKSFVDISKFIW
jgi:hypothetical protein